MRPTHAFYRTRYNKAILYHFENPQNIGKMDSKDKKVGTGLVGSPACGDVVKLQIKIEDNIIKDAKFKTFGCGSAIASSSLVTSWLKGKTITEASYIKDKDIAKHLSLPTVKLHCSLLVEDAIEACIKNYHNKNLD